jgi:hypothetical protein
MQQRLKLQQQQQQALMQQALLQQPHMYHPGVLAAAMSQVYTFAYFYSCIYQSLCVRILSPFCSISVAFYCIFWVRAILGFLRMMLLMSNSMLLPFPFRIWNPVELIGHFLMDNYSAFLFVMRLRISRKPGISRLKLDESEGGKGK